MQMDYVKISFKEDLHICHTNFAKKMERNLHETTSRWKTYGKRLFFKNLEVWDGRIQGPKSNGHIKTLKVEIWSCILTKIAFQFWNLNVVMTGFVIVKNLHHRNIILHNYKSLAIFLNSISFLQRIWFYFLGFDFWMLLNTVKVMLNFESTKEIICWLLD
jgi:hypothetical protein